MLREIRLATVILIVVTAVVVLLALNQTAIVNYGFSGVTDDVALSWGQNAGVAGEMTDDKAAEGAQPEATEEATEAASS